MKHTVIVADAQMEDVLKTTAAHKLRTAISSLQMWRKLHEVNFDVASHRCYTRALIAALTTANLAHHWGIGDAFERQGLNRLVEIYAAQLVVELERADTDFYK